MNWFDILIFAVLAGYFCSGFMMGFLRLLVGLFGFFISLFLALYASRILGERVASLIALEGMLPAQEVLEQLGLGSNVNWVATLVASIFCFLALFTILQFIFRFLGRELKIINRIPVIGFANMAAGGALGFLKGALFIFIAISVLTLVPVEPVEGALDGSAIVSAAGNYLPGVIESLKNFFFNFFYLG